MQATVARRRHGDDGGIYILRHSNDEERWELTLFDSGTREQTCLSST